jgi:c-di-AMP phosphodiesterase-like protein
MEQPMPNRRRKKSHLGVSLPFQSAAKGMSTAQGRYTLYALLICAIVAMVLSQLLRAFMPVDLAMLIAFVVSAVILIVCLLKMKSIATRFENRRFKAFNERLEERKKSEDRDG